jgi:hypothetical protein
MRILIRARKRSTHFWKIFLNEFMIDMGEWVCTVAKNMRWWSVWQWGICISIYIGCATVDSPYHPHPHPHPQSNSSKSENDTSVDAPANALITASMPLISPHLYHKGMICNNRPIICHSCHRPAQQIYHASYSLLLLFLESS